MASIKREVIPLEVTLHVKKTLDCQSLKPAPVLEGDGGRELKSTDRTASTDASGEHVLAVWIDVGLGELVNIHVGRLLGLGSVSSMASINDGIKELGEDLVALFVTSHNTHGLDVRMSWVVNTSLDALGKGTTGDGSALLEAVVHLRSEMLCHEVGVLAQVGHLIRRDAIHGEGGILLGAVVWLVTTTELDPFGKLSNRIGEALWWVVGIALY